MVLPAHPDAVVVAVVRAEEGNRMVLMIGAEVVVVVAVAAMVAMAEPVVRVAVVHLPFFCIITEQEEILPIAN